MLRGVAFNFLYNSLNSRLTAELVIPACCPDLYLDSRDDYIPGNYRDRFRAENAPSDRLGRATPSETSRLIRDRPRAYAYIALFKRVGDERDDHVRRLATFAILILPAFFVTSSIIPFARAFSRGTCRSIHFRYPLSVTPFKIRDTGGVLEKGPQIVCVRSYSRGQCWLINSE